MTKTVRFPEGSPRHLDLVVIGDAARYVHDGYVQYGLIPDETGRWDWLAIPLDELVLLPQSGSVGPSDES